MKSDARNRFWWPRMSTNIDTYIAQCEVCAAARPSPPRAPLAPWPFPPQPWYRVHLDFLGPINNRTYLIIVDAYSKWVECFDVSSGYSTRIVIDKLCEVMSRFGLFHTIITDNGTSFVSDEFKMFCSKNSIVHLTSPTYNPISNGQAESSVKIIKKAIKNLIVVGVNQKDLNAKLNEFLFSYRNATHSTTNKSPAELVLGHKLRSRLDLLDLRTPSSRDATLDAVVKDKQCLQCNAYGGKRNVTFLVDEVVLIKVYKSQKPCWVKGIIQKKLGSTLYLVRIINTGVVLKKHTNQLLKTNGEIYNQLDEAEVSSGHVTPSCSCEISTVPPVVVQQSGVPSTTTVSPQPQPQLCSPRPQHQLSSPRPQPQVEANGAEVPVTAARGASFSDPGSSRQTSPSTPMAITPSRARRPRKVINYRQ